MSELASVVRDQVAARRPVDARERRSIPAFLEAFDKLTDPFNEHADRVHVTASAIVISDDGRRVLLHMHKRLNKWLQPGGHVDAGESGPQAALREVIEETGLPATLVGDELVHVDVHPGPRKHIHLDLRYRITSPNVMPKPPEGESQDVQWFAWHRAIARAEPGLAGILRALQPGEPVIRQARHTDAGDSAEVFLRSREFGVPNVPLEHTDSEVRRWMADEVVGRTDMWVAELDGTLVGLMVLEPGWITHLYLDPAWMGRGLGKRFMELAQKRHPTGLQLWTFQDNEGSRRFYERHSFVAVEFGDGTGNEERAPDVRYYWKGIEQ